MGSGRAASNTVLSDVIVGENGWHLLGWEDQQKEKVLRFVSEDSC